MTNDDDRLPAPIAPSPVMSIPDEFPADLRAIVEAELRAGNQIVEVGHTHPAPPAGAYVKLAQRVTTHPHASRGGVLYYGRNSSSYSGEFHDGRRFYFVLEPPLPPPPEPDMDAIRAAVNYSPPTDREGVVLSRFNVSLKIDYDKWKEGIGYDIQAIAAASPEERRTIEQTMLARGAQDWRDVEALAALDTPDTRRALQEAMRSPDAAVRMAVTRFAPQLVSGEERLASLLKALRTAEFYGGLSEALDQVEETHPPEVIDALFRGALERDGGVACHFAAMLFYLYGRAEQPFDWNHRPFFLRFNLPDAGARRAAFDELCAQLGVDPARYRE